VGLGRPEAECARVRMGVCYCVMCSRSYTKKSELLHSNRLRHSFSFVPSMVTNMRFVIEKSTSNSCKRVVS
jgi:hypothetical protein